MDVSETAVPDCPGCRQRDLRIAALERHVAELTRKIEELTRRLPPPPQPPPPRPQARYPAAPDKKPTGKKQGGQPGHPPHLKQRLPAERVSRVEHFIPKTCGHCQADLPRKPSPNDPEPSWHQVAELPPMTAEIVEYQGHARTCLCCGKVTREPIPAEIRARGVGPRLSSVFAYFAGAQGVSKRGLEEISETVFDAPIAVGTVSNLEEEMSEALAASHQEAVETVRQAPNKCVDETGWKQGGRKRWLWTAAATQVVAFMIHPLRNATALAQLLGEAWAGIVSSDRWCAYSYCDLSRRQLCWAHLRRNFKIMSERGGFGKKIADAALDLAKEVFDAWHLFRGGGLSRAQLQERVDPLERDFVAVLSRGMRGKCGKTSRFCVRLFGEQEALWTFAYEEGVEPTNNHAERVQRLAVLWRRRSFGCQSERGCRFVERILTAVQTLRLQKRPVLQWLTQALTAHRAKQTPPSLLPVAQG